MTEHLFNTDNSFWQMVGRVGDMIILTLLTLICCLPLVTAGASISAMNYVCFKLMEHDNENTVKNFFHSFRQNFPQGCVISLIMGAAGLFIWYDIWFMRWFPAVYGGSVLLYAGWAICLYLLFFYLSVSVYLFAFQARFYNSLSVTFKSSVVAAFKNLPKTVKMMAGDVCVFFLIILCFQYVPQIVIIPLLTALPLCTWYHAWVMRDILKLIPGKSDHMVEDEVEKRQ